MGVKKLHFEIKHNQRKPPKIYVRDRKTKSILGSFSFNDWPDLDMWPQLEKDARLEMQQFINNMKAISPYLNQRTGYNTEDIRFRLPSRFVKDWLDKCNFHQQEGNNFDIYDGMVKVFFDQLTEPDYALNQTTIKQKEA